jgi:ATP-dependent Clp protease ATP-binding subunit ClpC
MTSNLGTKELSSNNLGFGKELTFANHKMIESKIMKSVNNTFSPELINRIDETIVFHSLSENDIFKIIDLQLKDLTANLKKIGLEIRVSISAKRLLARRGYQPKYGARPMRREIQVAIEDYLSEVLLKRNFEIGTVIKVSANKNEFKFTFTEKNKSSINKT